MSLPPLRSTLFPYTTLFRSCVTTCRVRLARLIRRPGMMQRASPASRDGSDCPSQPTYKQSNDTQRRGGSHIHLHVSIVRSEEHTSELQSRPHLVCRLLLEKK